MKYIRYGHKELLIFPTTMTHADVAVNKQITSAGMCSFAIGYRKDEDTSNEEQYVNVHVWGESVSLGMGHADDDEEFIQGIISSNYL